jgi:mannan endo-1,4-beta-mannosidase
MHCRVALVCFISALFLPSCIGLLPSGEPDDFIKVRGVQFIHNGRPYYYAGTNLWYGCYLGSPGKTGDRGRLARELDSLQAMGLLNLRVLAASEESYIKRSVKPAIQKAPGQLDEELLAGLDFLLAEMADRHMHAVLYLNNYWEWSGGMAQYNVWTTNEEGMDPENPAHGWPAFMKFSARFYQNPKANALYRDFIRRIVTRTNSVNGRLYRDDPTIMSWQLANEPRPGPDGPETDTTLPLFYRWVDETAAYIHSLDTNHLVSSGSEGAIGFAWRSELFAKAHESKHIDYLTCHVWPKNWGWFDPVKFEETLPSSTTRALGYIREHIEVARRLGKPIVMEEFGLARDGAACLPGSPATARDRYFSTLFSTVYDSARAGSPLVGTNFWTWGGEGRAMHPDNMWREGDPFLGDPPQEPQGYNSVFLADSTTRGIIREHAFKMMWLGSADSLYAIQD